MALFGSRQLVGQQKLEKCGKIANKTYTHGYTRGGWPHGIIQCWVDSRNADLVDTYARTARPVLRHGRFVDFIVHSREGGSQIAVRKV